MVDSFFVNPAKKSRKRTAAPDAPSSTRSQKRTRPAVTRGDEEITSDSDLSQSELDSEVDQESQSEDEETEADKRRRLAKEYIQNLEEEAYDENAFDAKDLDREIISRRLVQDVAENQGKVFRMLEGAEVGQVQLKRTRARNLTGVAVSRTAAFTVSKDRTLQKWNLAGKLNLIKQINAAKAAPSVGHTGDIVAIAANDKYVVTGGLDRRFIVWSAESLEPVKIFDITDRNGAVLSLAFRSGTDELYVGCEDLRIRCYDLKQMVFVEALYGHQDGIIAISALAQERCVSVGQRDRTAMYWKIPEEARLTFRGGDTKLASKQEMASRTDLTLEGSLDCCALLDNQFFVTGSDNGNISLWSIQRKKPLFTQAVGHGYVPQLSPSQASAETDPTKAEIPPAQPRGITALAAVPYSDTFFTGSYSGTLNMWRMNQDQRGFSLVKEIRIGKGVVTGISVAVADAKHNEFTVFASLSREPRLGRWFRVSGHDALAKFSLIAPK